MLLRSATLKDLQDNLIELRITLSDFITRVYILREKIQADAAELYELPHKKFFSRADIEKIKNINSEAQQTSGLEKSKELIESFEQVDMLSAAIFADGIIGLQTVILDNLTILLIKAIQEMLNSFYFKLGNHISVHKKVDAFFLKNPTLSKLVNPKKIYFNADTKRTELSFSDALTQMPLPNLIQCANDVMWAVKKAGVRHCQRVLTRLHNLSVIDGQFGDYLRCERWIRSGGYYWLTVRPQTKTFVEEKLASQEIEGFAKYCDAFSDLKLSAEKKMAFAKSNLNVDIILEAKITELKATLIQETEAAALLSQYASRPPRHPARALSAGSSAFFPPLSPESKSPDLLDELHQLLQIILADATVEKFWCKVTSSFWAPKVKIGKTNYPVPTGILLAREKLKLSTNKWDAAKNICLIMRGRMTNPPRRTTPLYSAVSDFLEQDNLVITQNKLDALRALIQEEMSDKLKGNPAFELIARAPLALR